MQEIEAAGSSRAWTHLAESHSRQESQLSANLPYADTTAAAASTATAAHLAPCSGALSECMCCRLRSQTSVPVNRHQYHQCWLLHWCCHSEDTACRSASICLYAHCRHPNKHSPQYSQTTSLECTHKLPCKAKQQKYCLQTHIQMLVSLASNRTLSLL